VNDLLVLEGSITSLVLGLTNHVELVLTLVKISPGEPEANTTSGGQDGNDGVVPHEQGVGRQGDQSLTKSGGEGSLEEVDTHDEATHVLGSLAEGVLETGDRGEDLREGDQAVGDGLDPDVDGGLARGVSGNVVARARRQLVDVVLHNTGGDHGG